MKWPPAGGPRPARGVIRAVPADFRVEEQLGFEADGTGEHVLMQVEKTGANTGWVATQLARHAALRTRDVGFAGRKDRHAVCTQWFSLWMPGAPSPDWQRWDIDGVTILDVARHGRKLKPGSHAGNRFEIVVRELQADAGALQRRLANIGSMGVPNYFGAQRFGREFSNLSLARAWFAGRARPQRAQRSLALSAARAAIFNDVLAARIEAGTWATAGPGDCLNLDGSASFFACETVCDETAARLAAGDLHVSGPLWGAGEPQTSGAVADLECAVAARHGDLAAGLVRAGLKQQRRALRCMPRDFEWDSDGATLTLRFGLPAGEFASAVLDEFLDYAQAPAGEPSWTAAAR